MCVLAVRVSVLCERQFLRQHCPVEISTMVEMLCICIFQQRSYWPLVATEHVNCVTEEVHFKFYLI